MQAHLAPLQAAAFDYDKSSIVEKPDSSRKRRFKTTTACNNCKASRKRCIPGPNKCISCVAQSLECVYDEHADYRRRNRFKENWEASEQQNRLLLGVLTAIRACPKTQLKQIMNIVRSDASLGEVANTLNGRAEYIKEAKIREGSVVTEATSPQDSMRISNLIDQPLHLVPAKSWTSVTDDDHLVSHLISIYFTWEHIFFVRMDRRLFLQDMIAGRSTFCSPLLVSAMLAHATHLSGLFTGSGHLNGSDLGARFSAEAQRLWQLEIGRRDITTVQALMIMNATSNGEGNDKLGWFYLTTAVRLSLDMQLQRELSYRPNETVHDMRRVRRLTAWGLFYSQNFHNFVLQKENFIRKPPIAQIPHVDGGASYEWIPYPDMRTSKPSLTHEVFGAQCSLAIIASEMSVWLYEGDDGPKDAVTFEQALSFESRLESWKASQLDVLVPNENSPPHVLLLSLHYYDLLIAAFKPFIEDPPAGLASTDSIVKDPQARAMYFSYIENLKHLLGIFRRNYGWNHCIPYMLHKLAIVAFYELENLTNEESCSSFLGSIDGIRQMAISWFVAKPILRMIELYTEKVDKPVPPEAWQIFAFNHDEPWVHDGVGQVLKMYPSGAFRSEIYGGRLDGLFADMEREGYDYDGEDERDDESGDATNDDSLKETPGRQGEEDAMTLSQSSDPISGASRNPVLANLLNLESEWRYQPPSNATGGSLTSERQRSASYSHSRSFSFDNPLGNSS